MDDPRFEDLVTTFGFYGLGKRLNSLLRKKLYGALIYNLVVRLAHYRKWSGRTNIWLHWRWDGNIRKPGKRYSTHQRIVVTL